MIVLITLLLAAQAPESASPAAITIDPCVEVDSDEVRRLTAIELRSFRSGGSLEAFDVFVGCDRGLEELRLTDRRHHRTTVRSIDLRAAEVGDRDAKTRELALAIAELVRRAEVESAPDTPPVPAAPATAGAVEPPPALPKPEPWRLELGLTGVLAGSTGGETLFGADLSGRLRLTRWLIADLRLGGRKTRPIELENGSLDALGMAAAAGLAFDMTPGFRRAGVAFGARFSGDWLRYRVVSDGDEHGSADAAALCASGTTTAFVALSESWRLTMDASVGGALHAIVLEENERRLSGLRGVVLASAFGVAAQF